MYNALQPLQIAQNGFISFSIRCSGKFHDISCRKLNNPGSVTEVDFEYIILGKTTCVLNNLDMSKGKSTYIHIKGTPTFAGLFNWKYDLL